MEAESLPNNKGAHPGFSFERYCAAAAYCRGISVYLPFAWTAVLLVEPKH